MQFAYITNKLFDAERLPDGNRAMPCVHLQHAQIMALASRRWPSCINSGVLQRNEGAEWEPAGFAVKRDFWAIGLLVALVVDRALCPLPIDSGDSQLNPLLVGRVADVVDNGVQFVLDIQPTVNYSGRGFVIGASCAAIPLPAILWWAPVS